MKTRLWAVLEAVTKRMVYDDGSKTAVPVHRYFFTSAPVKFSGGPVKNSGAPVKNNGAPLILPPHR